MNPTPIFPIKRQYYHSPIGREYYAYGNTIPEDFLDSCTNRTPSVLSLGCGDIRSCFYGLWKHFDKTVSSAPSQYDSVLFTLLDYCPAILARNVIFIYLALNLPEDAKAKKDWLSGMWAIWYCHELSHAHATLLTDSLKYLLNFSASLELWNSDDNILKTFVHFDSASSFSKVSEVWKGWFTFDTKGRSVKLMQISREQLLKEKIKNLNLFCDNFARISTFVYGKQEDSQHLKFQASEVRSYISSGNSYAELVLDSDIPKSTSINQSLYENSKQFYSLHYGCVPFRAYQQTYELSPNNLNMSSLNPSDIVVESEHFQDKPFLANSVQQFILWVQSVSRVLNEHSKNVQFVLSTQDALVFCHDSKHSSNGHQFSAIYTSNLMDHVGLPNLVLSCIPLLSENGALFTTSMIIKNCTSTVEEFLRECFGFDSSLFPVMLGIRCINHEGAKCSSLVKTRPVPPDIANREPHLPNIRKLLWEKLPQVQRLNIKVLPNVHPGNITDALVNMVCYCLYSSLNPSPVIQIQMKNTIETAILMLQYFIDNLNENSLSNFWNPVCSELRKMAHPYLLSLQTHLLLHQIHIHLVVNDEECPLCNKVPVQDVIGLFSVSISIRYLPSDRTSPIFYVFFYKDITPMNINDLLNQSLAGKDVHIFDSFDLAVTNDQLQLHFYIPLHLIHKNYEYKLALSLVSHKGSNMIEVPELSGTQSSKGYRFFKLNSANCPNLSSQKNDCLTTKSHCCNGYETSTVLTTTCNAGDTDAIHIQRVSPKQIKIIQSSSPLTVNFNYPTCQEKLEIKDTTITVTCKRMSYSFDKERPRHIVSPDHQVSFPVLKNCSKIIKQQSSMQFTKVESALKTKVAKQDLPPLIRVKLALSSIFEKMISCHQYVQINHENQNDLVLMVLKNILFDYNLGTPALDLAFSFTTKSATGGKCWESNLGPAVSLKMTLSSAQFESFKSTITFFSKQTNGNLQSCNSKAFSELFRLKIDHLFSRAVLYLLLCDADKFFHEPPMYMQWPLTAGAYCAKCRIVSFTHKKCANCLKVYYCSKQCQESDWKLHRQSCSKAYNIPSKESIQIAGFFTASESDKECLHCSFCKKTSEDLKKCSRCRTVQYCNADCQTSHWKTHKHDCKK